VLVWKHIRRRADVVTAWRAGCDASECSSRCCGHQDSAQVNAECCWARTYSDVNTRSSQSVKEQTDAPGTCWQLQSLNTAPLQHIAKYSYAIDLFVEAGNVHWSTGRQDSLLCLHHLLAVSDNNDVCVISVVSLDDLCHIFVASVCWNIIRFAVKRSYLSEAYRARCLHCVLNV